ncbi:MAG: magnesium transporter [Ruminococcaceae bacterium]|nr:magnesium transporter [Oscillospiraceae bacterium]
MNNELKQFLDEKRFVEFMKAMDTMNAVDAAEFIATVEAEERPIVFRMLKKDTAAAIFAELDSDVQEQVIGGISEAEIAKIMEHLAVDDTVDMLEELPANMVRRILRNTPPHLRGEINRYLKYSEDSVGSIMTPELISIYSDWTVERSVEYIRKTGIDKETVYVIYVTDASKILIGIIELKDLLFASPSDKISELMNTSVIVASTTDDKESAAATISKYDLLALPVVDSENRLVGIVTIDDAVDVIYEEATEDIEKMAAITPTDKPYLKTGVFATWRKRIPWLLLLMVSATFTGTIITHYEQALGQMVILTAFIPMLMDSGGNAGGQASVTIIRGLSLGELRMGNIFTILWKEFRVSLLCGITLAVTVFAKAILIDQASYGVAATVSLTLLATIVIAKLVGCSLPILAKRVGFDPAVMASPFITTIVDAVALWIYFLIAGAILGV